LERGKRPGVQCGATDLFLLRLLRGDRLASGGFGRDRFAGRAGVSARNIRLVSIPSSDPAFQQAIDVIATFDGLPPEALRADFQTRLRGAYPAALVVDAGTVRVDGHEEITWLVYRDENLLLDKLRADA